MPEEDQKGSGNPLDEIVWTVQRSKVLFRYWTMPLLDGARSPDTPKEDTIGARALALLVIVALTFAVRGNPGGAQVPFTALAAAVAAALSFVLNLLANTAKVTVREPALISAYASTILVMVGYLFFRDFFSGVNWYEDHLVDFVGPIFAAVIMSVLTVYVFLGLKAALWDKHQVTIRSAAVGLGITIGSGGIVCTICYMSSTVFDYGIHILCRFFGTCTT